jgi:RNA polymerase sigma-70 factor, ECF subfamily
MRRSSPEFPERRTGRGSCESGTLRPGGMRLLNGKADKALRPEPRATAVQGKGEAMNPEQPAPDASELQEDLARDLDAAFEGLVLAYQDRLFAFAFRLCASREDAEEVAQDAFVRAYRALKVYPPDRIRALALRAWLYQIALNVARNRFRRKRRPMVSLDHGRRGDDGGFPKAIEPADDPEGRPDRRLEKRRARRDVASLVRALPDRYRAPIVLRYVEGLPVEEVAAILKQPVGTAKSNLHRGVNALRISMTRSRAARFRAPEVSR